MNIITEIGWSLEAVNYCRVYIGSTDACYLLARILLKVEKLRSQLERSNPQKILLTIENGDIFSFLDRKKLKQTDFSFLLPFLRSNPNSTTGPQS